jgi:hypothetical protein
MLVSVEVRHASLPASASPLWIGCTVFFAYSGDADAGSEACLTSTGTNIETPNEYLCNI